MKLGIVMEGGASRTVFSCGVADALLDENIMPDYFIGVSAGIAFGLSYLSGQRGRNRDLARYYMCDKRYMGMKHLFRDRNYYNLPFVFDEIPNKLLPYDYEAFAAYSGTVEAGVTNLRTGGAEYLEVPRNDRQYRAVVASCALPVLFQPVKIGRNYYLDGGVSDSIPFEHALEQGCDKLIVLLTRTRDYVKEPEKAGDVTARMYKNYPQFTQALLNRPEVYNASRERLFEMEKEGRVFVAAPETTFGVRRTDSDPDKLMLLYYDGYYQMHGRMRELKKYLGIGE